MSKFTDLLSNIAYSMRKKARNSLCISNIHDWIYIFDENGQPTKRYCENCRRQERYSEVTEEYLRIKDISYTEM